MKFIYPSSPVLADIGTMFHGKEQRVRSMRRTTPADAIELHRDVDASLPVDPPQWPRKRSASRRCKPAACNGRADRASPASADPSRSASIKRMGTAAAKSGRASYAHRKCPRLFCQSCPPICARDSAAIRGSSSGHCMHLRKAMRHRNDRCYTGALITIQTVCLIVIISSERFNA